MYNPHCMSVHNPWPFEISRRTWEGFAQTLCHSVILPEFQRSFQQGSEPEVDCEHPQTDAQADQLGTLRPCKEYQPSGGLVALRLCVCDA